MKNENKQIYTIMVVQGFDDSGETTAPLGSRYCTIEEIKEEIDFLNNNINEAHNDLGYSWLYFEYQKVEILPQGKFNKNFNYSTNNKTLNLQGLTNFIINDFDRMYKNYTDLKKHYPEKPFRDWFGGSYEKFLTNDFYYKDMVELIKKCSEEGKIKTDASVIDFYENDLTIKETLSQKFKMKR